MPDINIYEALRESHEIQRALCRSLLNASPEGDERDEIFKTLRIELAAHAAAEERDFYSPMMLDDMGLDPSRHAMAEHHEIDEYVEDLASAEARGGSWLSKAKKLSDEVFHHLDEEEKKFFQISGRILNDAQKARLAEQYLQDYVRMKRVLSGE
ncbi:hemerythrin domain-containing protein [Bordetella sp. 15P40C-2]|uniref:hemerythrin domain-containing protein n=1 Tax=Bordetella sp. 15P40C-2 TaxID=2572246 RepID=UPI00351BB7BE